ncbi:MULTISPECIES: flavin monoamine oxidase family protein [Sorangium]|uniref:flavin monoamine oxidase family protein n=1 Tax=Sorangium TaxID=39643 RepID=UPI003D9C6483
MRLPDFAAAEQIHDFDVAVVGGGVSGAYTAFRLRHAATEELGPKLRALAAQRPDGKLRVGLFESSDRIGGRLFSLTLPGVSDTPVELGGMRFLNSHQRVMALVNLFQLAYRPLPVEDPLARHMYYLRGQHFTAADWADPAFNPPYRLERGERARSPGSLLHEVVLRHRAALERYPERYRDVGFWNLLLAELSDQAYRLIRDATGYDSLVSNWSAADAIPYLIADFAPGSMYFALHKGFEELPRELARRFSAAGGETRMRHRLHRVDREGELLRLTFDVGEGTDNLRRVDAPAVCRAHHVVLAMPRRALELLHQDSFMFDSPRFESDVTAVLPQAGFKIFAAYRRPWWKTTRGITAGRSITDLPVRQCYYWVTGDETPGAGNPNSILMASYNDGASVAFWAGLTRNAERYQAPPEVFPPGVAIPEDLRGAIAPAPLILEMQSQLCELHGLGVRARDGTFPAILPYLAVFQDWTRDPFGGGWHFWKVGADSKRIARRMQRPVAAAPLYVCGEAWSHQQGWVEGALETADAVLEQELLVPPPTWIGGRGRPNGA